MQWIDGTLYPDRDVPARIECDEDRIDFVARLCSSWDFGVLPRRETIEEVRKPEWRTAVDRCRLLTSCTYHLLRKWHGLPSAPSLGSISGYIREDPNLEYV